MSDTTDRLTPSMAEALEVLENAGGRAETSTYTSAERGIINGPTATALERRGMLAYRGPGKVEITDKGREFVAARAARRR